MIRWGLAAWFAWCMVNALPGKSLPWLISAFITASAGMLLDWGPWLTHQARRAAGHRAARKDRK